MQGGYIMNSHLNKQFWKYVLPSMCITTLGVFYGIVDGFFIGRTVGDNGLAAINMAWPITALITATSTGIGIGGSVLMSTRQGENDIVGTRKSRGNTILLLATFTILFTCAFSLFTRQIISFLGAKNELLKLASDYTRVIALGCGFQIFSIGINPILRNNGKPNLAMSFMIVGLVGNIMLDGLFIRVFGWGLLGAAFATVVAQSFAAILSLIALFSDKNHPICITDCKPDKFILPKIFKIGLSPFGLSFAPSAIIIITNWQSLNYGGTTAVAAYSVLSYGTQTIQAMLQGAGDGVQPLVSYYNGSNEQENISYLQKKTLHFTIIVASILTMVFILMRRIFPVIFGASMAVSRMVYSGMIISSFAFVFSGLNRFTCAFFYAIDRPKLSSLLVYLEPLIVSPICLLLLPILWGINGIWIALPVSQFIISIISIYLLKRYKEEIQLTPSHT
ncbi:multidrug transporter MATE [Clostridium tetani]|nr:multidrug transporter MATE [Clostridium tetani]